MTDSPATPESEVSRAIDDVLAAEQAAENEISAAAATAENIRRTTSESAHRILATAERRIGAVHRKVAADLRAEIALLHETARADAADADAIELDDHHLEQLAAGAAAWLTTDADE